MIKAILSYSKKIPADQKFSSQSFHLSLEQELPDNIAQTEMQEQIHQTYILVKNTVEKELANGNGVQNTLGDMSTVDTAKGSDDGNSDRATNKQIRYLCDLARDQKIEVADMNKTAKELYGTDLYGLSKADASKFLSAMKAGELKAA